MNFLGLSGSLRANSSNSILLAAARSIAAPFATIEIWESIADLPHFNPDLDGDSPPSQVTRFRQAVTAANALLISTPEYAHGIPGSLKNALDWLVSDPNFAGKPVGILFGSATESEFARQALVEVLKTMSARVHPDAVVSIAGVRSALAADGSIRDPRVAAEVLRALRALGAQAGKSG